MPERRLMRSVKVGQEQSSAKRAGRAPLELAMLLSDGDWHSTSYLGIAAGKYMRPEIAWRIGCGHISHGQRQFINSRLGVWERAGRIEKRRNGKFTEWKLAKTEWVVPYLRRLIETLREQLDRPSNPSPRKARLLERAERRQEIIRLRKEGFSLRQIAEKVGCHHSTVIAYLKAAR